MSNWQDVWETDVTEGGSLGPRRMKLKPGVVSIIRLAVPFYAEAWVHHIKLAGKNGKSYIRRIVCLGKGVCPVCEKGNNAKHRFYYNVIDVKEMKEKNEVIVKLLETGPEIYRQIRSIVRDEDYKKHNPTSYNLKIERQGEGQYDTSYYVKASPKIKPLSQKIVDKINRPTDEGGKYNLDDQKIKLTKAEIIDILNGDDKKEEEKEVDSKQVENLTNSIDSKPTEIKNEGFDLDEETKSDDSFDIDDIDDSSLGEDF